MDGKLDLEKHFLNDLVLDNGWITPTMKATIKDKVMPDRSGGGGLYGGGDQPKDGKKA
jgi:hypothetical protein